MKVYMIFFNSYMHYHPIKMCTDTAGEVHTFLISSSLVNSHACCVGSWGKRALLCVEMVTGRP